MTYNLKRSEWTTSEMNQLGNCSSMACIFIFLKKYRDFLKTNTVREGARCANFIKNYKGKRWLILVR
jgi:hypothetical protein